MLHESTAGTTAGQLFLLLWTQNTVQSSFSSGLRQKERGNRFSVTPNLLISPPIHPQLSGCFCVNQRSKVIKWALGALIIFAFGQLLTIFYARHLLAAASYLLCRYGSVIVLLSSLQQSEQVFTSHVHIQVLIFRRRTQVNIASFYAKPTIWECVTNMMKNYCTGYFCFPFISSVSNPPGFLSSLTILEVVTFSSPLCFFKHLIINACVPELSVDKVEQTTFLQPEILLRQNSCL